jgi:hypothetical protein
MENPAPGFFAQAILRRPENEIHRADEAESGPDVEQCEGDENREGDFKRWELLTNATSKAHAGR